MPELAEVEFMRRRWEVGLHRRIDGVELHPRVRVFRRGSAGLLAQSLPGALITGSGRSGKQMIFGCGDAGWLGVHLGMTGELRVEPAAFVPGRHDHLTLRQPGHCLVFADPRMFGAVTFDSGPVEPAWWRERPPEILDPHFTRSRLVEFLQRRRRAPLKAVLLMQERFPGVGNWMADEVLWRAGLHPARMAGSLEAAEVSALFRALRFVCRGALRTIVVGGKDGAWGDPPRAWLFHQRWVEGGTCPLTGAALQRTAIGGRTTCWSPARQKGP